MSKTTDEALARLEHKMDLTLDIVMEMAGRLHLPMKIPKMKEGSHQCPVCREFIKYVIDTLDKSVTRQCGCKTGKFAPLDLEQFAPPPAAGGRHGQSERDGDSTSDGDAPSRGRGGSKGPRNF